VATPGSDAALYELRDSSCVVCIEALQAADLHRGAPASQRRERAQQRDPRLASNYAQESIDDRYLSCTYRVRLGDAQYRSVHAFTARSRTSQPAWQACLDAAEAAAKSILAATAHCSDLSRARFYDIELEPMSGQASEK